MPPPRGETSEFSFAFHRETDSLMRGRLTWFIVIWGGLGVLGLVAMIAMAIPQGGFNWLGITSLWRQIVFGLVSIGWVAAYVGALILVQGRLLGRRLTTKEVVRLSIALIAVDGLYFVAARTLEINAYNLFWFWFSHLIACIVFPWRVREALVPIAVVLPVSLLAKAFIEYSGTSPDPLGSFLLGEAFGIAFILAALSPAVLLCWFKHSQRLVRSSNRFLNERYGMLRQELAYARQVHEALFPVPITQGPVHFHYKYEPMRQIGGDYLHAHVRRSASGSAAVSVVVVDVTGHGIPAALTVNRLHGELDLRFAENPDITPGELLRHLNRYVNLTLARHSIFATAVCVRVDPERSLVEYASGGHPPAFMLGCDGTIRELGSTALVLGAARNEDYEPAQVDLAFHPGDTLILYTDGAVEARRSDGRMLRISGLRDAIADCSRRPEARVSPGRWPECLLDIVTGFRGGSPPEDDTLLVELHRPLGPPTAPG